MSGGGNGGGEVGLQIAPILDVLFVLLLFFMVSAGSQHTEAELGIKLPPKKARDSSTPLTPIGISIDAGGQVFLNDAAIDTPSRHDMPQLTARLRGMMTKFGSDQPVLISPDSRTKHYRVVDVLNAASAAHVKNLALSKSGG